MRLKGKNYILLILSIFSILSCNGPVNRPAENKEKTQFLKFGEIKPEGWIKAQMEKDLEEGFVGHLDELVPDLIVEDDIYGADRLTKKVKSKDVGAISDGSEWEVQFLWWNSETQSNWWDGLIRHAILTENEENLERVRKYVADKLSTQDENGYLGIYADDLRYNHTTENGELWAQTSLFRGLLAYYEATGDKKVLDAVERAVKVTMDAYPVNESKPFNIQEPFAGVGHGLTFTDVLDQLYHITGNWKYLEYAIFLYEDYNKHPLAEVDIQIKNLMDPEYKFKGHGVHTYEHLRALTIATYASDDPKYELALDAYLSKLSDVLTPAGGPIGDEWIAERTAHTDSTGYEYCSIQELLHSYSLLLQKTGQSRWAEKIEWLLFNAGQGARHPDEHSIAYCKTDNSYHMMGALDLDHVGEDHQNRYKYSPAHQDVAVCCVPNAGRIYPYYVNAMWMRNEEGIIANLFGASEVNTSIKGQEVKIIQETLYPFDFRLLFTVETEGNKEFVIFVRKPSWAKRVDVNSKAKVEQVGDYFKFTKAWQSGDQIALKYEAEPVTRIDKQGKQYISYGPLVFALELEGEAVEIKDYDLEGFRDLHYKPTVSELLEYPQLLRVDTEITMEEYSIEKPWESIALKGWLYNPDNKDMKEVMMVPMGGTVLRKIAFDKADF